MIRFCFIDSTFLLLEKQSAVSGQREEKLVEKRVEKRLQQPTEVDTLLPQTPSETRSNRTNLCFGLREASEPPAFPGSQRQRSLLTLSSMTRGFSLRRPQTSDRCL